ncbi:MAG: hypothetical protein ACI3Z0_08875 [Candidatus Cryptobacteroides sp.]
MEILGRRITFVINRKNDAYEKDIDLCFCGSVVAGCAKENIDLDIDAPYVTFSAESEQAFSWNFQPEFTLGKGQYFEYRVGNGGWNRFKTTLIGIPFGGSQGDLQLRGISSQGTASVDRDKWTAISFGNDVPVSCHGDIRTLVDYKNYETANTSNVRFCNLFSDCIQLTSAPELPATDLATKCYIYMFYGCKSLETAPALPATILADYCYACMFADCTALTKTPVLPDAQLAYGCYFEMFSRCSNLSKVWIKAKPSFTDETEAVYPSCVDHDKPPHMPLDGMARHHPRLLCNMERHPGSLFT